MEKKNTGLIILVVILSVLIVGLSGYIVYDKILNKNDMDSTMSDNENNVDDNVNSDDTLSNAEALVIVNELAEKYFTYIHSLGPYCGEFNSHDYISFGSYETQDFRDYWASTSFKSKNELKEYYKSIMIEELFPSYLDNEVSYLEQDGKLYCQLSHKGNGYIYNKERSSFKINSINNNSIIAEVVLASNQVDYINKREGTIEITKNSDDIWVISKYNVEYTGYELK